MLMVIIFNHDMIMQLMNVNLRTTNACESFHSHFKENFYKEKPNISMWLNIMKQIQTYIYCLIRSINTPKKSRLLSKQTSYFFTLFYFVL